ncbi:MAG: diguanylate cyclase [Candidatus Dormibacteria bacterium]
MSLQKTASAALTILLFLALAVTLRATQEAAREDLARTFASRADLSARFAGAYIEDVTRREKANAEANMSEPTVPRATLEQVSRMMGFEAAVLLDDRGRVLQVLPNNPAVVGTEIASRYQHLSSAERGSPAVSGVVSSAAAGRPVVAFAVPFQTSSGRRIFSGGFDVGHTPLGAYLSDSLPYPGATSDVVDQAGRLIATSRRTTPSSLAAVDPDLARAAPARLPPGSTRHLDGRLFVVQRPPGTPWILVNSVPESALYSALNGGSLLIPWVVLVGMMAAAVYILVLVSRLSDSRAALAATADTDGLTGLANRRSLDRGLAQETARAGRAQLPLSLAMIDIDHFKRYNDQFGHQSGDELLKAVANAWEPVVRDVDLLARYGGEEFVLVMPGCSVSDAVHAVTRLRAATPVPATASVGVVQWEPGESASDLVRRADAALYAAKHEGRDRVVVHSFDEAPVRETARV